MLDLNEETADVPQSDYLPALPTVEILFLNTASQFSVPDNNSYSTFLQSPNSLGMTFDAAEWLRACPKLHSIYFCHIETTSDFSIFSLLDTMEKSHSPTVKIQSFRHEDKELIHARLHLQAIDVSPNGDADQSEWEMVWSADNEGDKADLDGASLAGRRRLPPIWRDCTDYNGLAPPVSVIEDMRTVEGIIGDWDRRNIVVGEQTWRVLEEYDEGPESEAGSDCAGVSQ